ncbi:MAG: hypothetical protein JSS07_02150 [Proteobacteria bacterium]|nr:hypothetical protein [Pseudomonadota bacterium]
MMLDKLPFPKHITLIVMLVIFIIMMLGYGLYFNAKTQIYSKDREYEILKEKAMHSQENYDELKNKYDGTSAELTQLNTDYQTLLQHQQECKEKQEDLQTKYEELILNHEKTKASLREAQVKLGITPEEPSISEPQSNTVHPVKLLNKSDADVKTTASSGYHCPDMSDVSLNAPSGNWKDANQLTWHVDFTSRPLHDKEIIHDLFKILYDGESIACYYALGADEQNTWIVIKSQQDKKKPFKLSKDGWQVCTSPECKNICEKDSLKACSFTLP